MVTHITTWAARSRRARPKHSPVARREEIRALHASSAPSPLRVEPPRPRIEAVRIVAIRTPNPNAWADFAAVFRWNGSDAMNLATDRVYAPNGQPPTWLIGCTLKRLHVPHRIYGHDV
jgi:hypothetical protein